MKDKKQSALIIVLSFILIMQVVCGAMALVIAMTNKSMTYDEFVSTATIDTKEATIGTNIFLHQKIYGVDHTNYRYKLQTDCPHWKYDDRYMSEGEPLPYTEKEAAVETEAKELSITLNGDTLLISQHFYVPVLDLYDEDVTFEDWEKQQIQTAYDTVCANYNERNEHRNVLLICFGMGIVTMLLLRSVKSSQVKSER